MAYRSVSVCCVCLVAQPPQDLSCACACARASLSSLQELRKTNKLDVDDLTVESGLFKSFDEIVRRQLDPVWHSLGRKVKQVDGVRQGKMGCSIGRWGAALVDGVQQG